QIQALDDWDGRPKVHMFTSGLLTLAELVSGVRIDDQQFINLLFNPVLAAAAEDITKDLLPLAKIGVDLRNVDPRRLEWDVKKDFEAELLQYAESTQGGTPGR